MGGGEVWWERGVRKGNGVGKGEGKESWRRKGSRRGKGGWESGRKVAGKEVGVGLEQPEEEEEEVVDGAGLQATRQREA